MKVIFFYQLVDLCVGWCVAQAWGGGVQCTGLSPQAPTAKLQAGFVNRPAHKAEQPS